MRLARALLLSATATTLAAQQRETVEQQLIRLMADLRIERRAQAAVDDLVALGSAAVPTLAAALEVLPTDTLDNQVWKEGVLAALERLGPDARAAGPELLVAAFSLPVTLSERAFAALGAVGPSAHVRLALEDASAGSGGVRLNGMSIPGTADRAAHVRVIRMAAETCQRLRTGAGELGEVRAWLAAKGEGPPPTAERIECWTPLLQDMVRQGFVLCLLLPGLKQDPDILPVARALVRLHADAPQAEDAHALLLLKGTPDEQSAAARALGHRQTSNRYVVRALRGALYHSDPRVVRDAITGLGLAGQLALSAAADLQSLCANSDRQIAQSAAAALRAIGR